MPNQVKRGRRTGSLQRRVLALTALVLMFSMQGYSEQKNSADNPESFGTIS